MARYYRSDVGRNAPVSTEITGYAASTLVYLYEETGQDEYLESAGRAARFLTRMAWDRERRVMPFECSPDSPVYAYFFDCGIIVRGLLAVWRATRVGEFIERAIECARFMALDFQDASAFHPILELPSKRPLPHGSRWSRSPGCYQLKSALAWYELYEETGDAEYLALFEAVLAFSLETHTSFLPGPEPGEQTMDRLHAYCYFLEALLPVASRPDCARVLAEGIGRVSHYLREISPVFERSDVNAQLLRLRLLADFEGALPMDTRPAQYECARTRAFQVDDSGRRICGGFAFGQKAGKLLPFINPVSTAFGLQALRMYHLHETGGVRLSRRSLI